MVAFLFVPWDVRVWDSCSNHSEQAHHRSWFRISVAAAEGIRLLIGILLFGNLRLNRWPRSGIAAQLKRANKTEREVASHSAGGGVAGDGLSMHGRIKFFEISVINYHVAINCSVEIRAIATLPRNRSRLMIHWGLFIQESFWFSPV